MTEYRTAIHAEVRAPDGERTFEAVVMNYGLVDDYNTVFDPGVFKASLEARLPRITWAHNWAEPLGRYVDYKDTDDSLTLVGEFDDFDAVPRARQAHAQLVSGTIDQFSVGFVREDTRDSEDGVTHFTKARLDEAALVLAGAVPGTKLVGVRNRSGLTEVRQVPFDVLEALSAKVAAGEMTQQQAAIALDLAAGDTPTEPETPDEPEPDDGSLAEAEHALEGLGL